MAFVSTRSKSADEANKSLGLSFNLLFSRDYAAVRESEPSFVPLSKIQKQISILPWNIFPSRLRGLTASNSIAIREEYY